MVDDWTAPFRATGWAPGGGGASTTSVLEAPTPSGGAGLGDWASAFKSAGWDPGGAASAAGRAVGGASSAVGTAVRAAGTDVEGYIRQAATRRGIDPDIAVRVAQSEGGLVPNQTGSFATGKSFWPFQLHYGGAGTPYEKYGTVAGMGNTFTERTGWQPGDPEAWQAATDYALDAAKQQGWGAWYGARKQGISGFQGINRAAPSGAQPGAPSAGQPAPTRAPGQTTAVGPAADDWSAAFRKAGWSPEAGGATSPRPGAAAAPGRPPTAAASAGPVAERQAIAASWALSNLGSKDFYNLCQRFIEQAYGTGGQYGSAAAAGKALFKTANPAEADVGDLVFFKPDASNGYAGHAAIYVGNGEMVGATNAGVTRDRIDSPYWSKLLVGFGDPPAQWTGRAGTADLVKGAQQFVGQARSAADPAAGGALGGALSGDWASAFRAAGWRP